MTLDEEKHSVYVDLDSIFDTRLALLSSLDKKLAEKCFYKDYHVRKVDAFGNISFKEFEEAYKKRSKIVLRNASFTPIIGYLYDFINNTISLNKNLDKSYIPNIVINTYPYSLNEDEIKIIGDSLITVFNGLACLEFVNLSIDYLTPHYFKHKFVLVYMYNPCEWLEFFSVNKMLTKVGCPDVGMISPYLVFQHHEHYTSDIIDDSLAALVDLASPFICLKHVPVKDFSIVIQPSSNKTSS